MVLFVAVAETAVRLDPAQVFTRFVAFLAPGTRPVVVILVIGEEKVFYVFGRQVGVRFPGSVIVPLPAYEEATIRRAAVASNLKDFVQVIGVFVATPTRVVYLDAVLIVKFKPAAGVRAFVDCLLCCFAGGDSCLLYTSPSPRDGLLSRMPSSA